MERGSPDGPARPRPPKPIQSEAMDGGTELALGTPMDAARTEYAALARSAAAGDRDAMERLLMRAQEVAYRFSSLVCGHPEDAEDVMQDALLKTFQHVHQLDDPTAFRTWLYATVRNACLMKRRKRAGEPAVFEALQSETGESEPRQLAAAGVPADERLIKAALDARLRRALSTLAPAYRIIVVLREVEGLSTREVAEVTGYSEANVKQRLHRARLMLQRHLEGS
jgi:RNA polymerase sigma-70 factor, ECF subfamily